MSWQAGAFAVLGLALAAGFAWYERRRPDARVVALVATMAAFGALGRIAFAAVPNVKPTTDIVLISGYALGAGPGFVVGALAALTSNFFFGQGPWTAWQMVGWGATGLIGAALAIANSERITRRRLSRWTLAGICGVVGFGFTVLQDVGDWVTYSDHSSGQLAVYVAKGLGFDAVHAVGCVLFALAFGPAMVRSLARFASRLEVTWQPPASVAPLLVIALVLTGATAGQSAARASATVSPVAYLLGAQNADGGFGSAPRQPSEPLFSGWAALALASAGADPQHIERGGRSVIEYLRATLGSASDPGSLERTILAVRAAGLSARGFGGRDLLAALDRQFGRNGSISDQVNLTTFGLLALGAAGSPSPPHALGWIIRQQDPDGGFSYGTAGGSSDVDDTAAVLEALDGTKARPAERARQRAVRFLEAHQDADGGFPSQPGSGSNAQSTAWALQGLIAARAPTARADRALGYLRSLIAPDGHVRYSQTVDQTPVWVTAEAVMALERKPLPLSRLLAPRPSRRPAPALLDRMLLADAATLDALCLAPIGLS